jgi:hypothetical protein
MKITFDLSNLVLLFSALSIVGSALFFLYRVAVKITNAADRINKHSGDIGILIKSSFVCLDGLTQLGANSLVSTTRDELQKHLIERGIIKDV